MKSKKRKKPNKAILNMLQGKRVPKDFKCDGCTMSPDGWFYWACRIHDYEAHDLRGQWDKMRWFSYDSKVVYEGWYRDYLQAEHHLKTNIRILSTFYIGKNNELKVRSIFHPKRLIGWTASNLYSKVTGSLMKWATVGKDNK